MSGIVRGAKKAFKKISKVVKRVLPIALAAGAIFFTAGAAMGMAPAWSAVAGSMTSGLTGTLGSVVTGAVTQAGQAAAIGGLVSEATGGKFSDGAKAGAVTGGLLGGVSGLASAPAAVPQVSAAQGSSVMDGVGGQFANMSPAPVAQGTMQAAAQGGAQQGLLSNFQGAQNIGQSAKGLMSGVGRFVENNPTMVGMAVQGLGQGLSAQAQSDEARKAEQRKQQQIEQNYSGQDFSGYRQFAAPESGAQPKSKRYLDYEYAYNPQTARIERKQRA